MEKAGFKYTCEIVAFEVSVGPFPNPDTLLTAPGRVHYGRTKCTD